MINDLDTAKDELLDFISIESMAIASDRLKALNNLRIIIESASTTVDQLRHAMGELQKENSDLMRKMTWIRNQ
mgnify:CR=1 FL=1